MELLALLAQRPVIATLAIAGAVLVMVASMTRRADDAQSARRADILSKAGYAVTFASIILFIVAGFLSGR